LSDPDLNAWRQNLNPNAYRDPAANGGRNPYDPFKDYKEIPGGGSHQDAWIPEGSGFYDRMAADGFVYSFPPSAFVSGSPLHLLAMIDSQYQSLTGAHPNWDNPAPGGFGSALPALDSAPQIARPYSQNPESMGSGVMNAGRLPRFANEQVLIDHFVDHGAEFGLKAASEYEAQAGQFLITAANSDIRQKILDDGDVVRFNPKTNEFGILSPDGRIRTYYILDTARHPNQSNLDYFNAQ
jgi:hypothetical protein